MLDAFADSSSAQATYAPARWLAGPRLCARLRHRCPSPDPLPPRSAKGAWAATLLPDRSSQRYNSGNTHPQHARLQPPASAHRRTTAAQAVAAAPNPVHQKASGPVRSCLMHSSQQQSANIPPTRSLAAPRLHLRHRCHRRRRSPCSVLARCKAPAAGPSLWPISNACCACWRGRWQPAGRCQPCCGGRPPSTLAAATAK